MGRARARPTRHARRRRHRRGHAQHRRGTRPRSPQGAARERVAVRRAWGRGYCRFVQPFECLRYLARGSDEDDGALVSEAADCLAGFADDPAGLVVACRRLVSHHPASGALWWLCARVLTASEPAEAAWEAWQLINDDGTTDRPAPPPPFPHHPPTARPRSA